MTQHLYGRDKFRMDMNENERKRIYVDQLPNSITKDDLIQLFSKLVKVLEIYIPGPTATGIPRDFAILNFQGDDELLRKCKTKVEVGNKIYDFMIAAINSLLGVKTFNGCHWKGSKIRVAMAHEYYLDRLNRENKSIPTPTSTPIVVPNLHHSLIQKEFNEGAILKVKRRKNEHVYIQTGTNSVPQSRDILPSGKRRKFTEDGNYLEPLNIPILEEKLPPLVKAAEVSEQQKENQEASVPPSRKGMRIGFGTIASLPPRSAPTGTNLPSNSKLLHAPRCDSCVEESYEFEKVAENNISRNRDLSHENIHGVEKEAIIITESGQYDDLSSSDGENCLSLEELTTESFNLERERQKRMISLIQEKAASSTYSSIGSSQTGENSIDILDIDAVPIIEPIKKSPFRSAVWSQTALRFDPTIHRMNEKYYLTKEEVQERDSLLKKSREGALLESGVSGTADLEKLKGIFHRDGGSGWDSTGKGVVPRDPNQSEKIDNIILEGEKYGFDFRDEKGDNESEKTKPKSNSMLFGFFDDKGGEDNGDGNNEDGVNDEDHETDESSQSDALDDEDDDNEIDEDSALSSTDDNLNIYDEQDNGDDESVKGRNNLQETDEDHEFHYPTFEEVLAGASKFKRDLSESKLLENWKKTRERLVLDYKRKSKDAKKRTPQYGKNGSQDTHFEVRGQKQPSEVKYSKGRLLKTRGGVKHRKKQKQK